MDKMLEQSGSVALRRSAVTKTSQPGQSSQLRHSLHEQKDSHQSATHTSSLKGTRGASYSKDSAAGQGMLSMAASKGA